MIQKLSIIAVVLVSLVASATQPVAEKDPRRIEVVKTEKRLVSVEMGKGQMIRLGGPATSVFIGDPAIADVQVKSPTLVYLLGKKAGETSLYAVDAKDRILANLRVSVTHNLQPIRDGLRALHPDSYIEVATVGDAVMLRGVIKSARIAEDARALAARYVGGDKNIINQLQVRGPNQVNLRVRVAEVSRTVVKQIGINWDAVMSTGAFAFGLATGNVAGTLGAAVTRTAGADSVFANFKAGGLDLNAVLDALENEGLVTVLAEPNLTSVTGETASFLAGGEFPITVPQSDGQVTIEFKKFGVGLSFTPTVLDETRISLKVRPEVSQLSSTGEVRLNSIAIPALSTRRAETTVELGSGQSFAIAGLIQNNVSHDVRKFPGLGDVPVLGALFRSDQFKRNETELVIVVTPYIVRPSSSSKFADPTQGFTMPSDRERTIGAAPLYKQKPGAGHAAVRPRRGRGLVGSAGFTLE
ncbi:MAG: type II and III secretion system protein family protein [Rhodospirillales bacterium]|jgi:pilus assembly protein CpaC|nr:type II and III secretion system protein family protein [Rhodospirillales bacterium]